MTRPCDLWVFAYGSLLWNPGFEPAETQLASLDGFQRSFCMWSIHHRGTPENMGLVLALDKDSVANCHGVALRVADADQEEVLAMLRERELISSAYLEQVHPVDLTDGRTVDAVCYVINREHEQYCNLSLEKQANVISNAVGLRGPNTEYLYNTVDHIEKLGIQDTELRWLVNRVRELAA